MSDIKIHGPVVVAVAESAASTITPSSGDGWTAAVGSLGKAFILPASNHPCAVGFDNLSQTNLLADDASIRWDFVDVDEITGTRLSGSNSLDTRHAFFIIEDVGPSGGDYEFEVRAQSETVTVSAGDDSGTITVSGVVDVDDVIPIVQSVEGTATANGFNSMTFATWMESSTSCIYYRGGKTGDVTAYVSVVEWVGPAWNVLHGSSGWLTTATDSGTISLKRDADGVTGADVNVDAWANAVYFVYHKQDSNKDNWAIVDSHCEAARGGADDEVDWNFQVGHDNTDTVANEASLIFAHVLIDTLGNMTVTEYSETWTAPTTGYQTDVDITGDLTALDESFAVVHAERGGSGAALSRGCWYVHPDTADLDNLRRFNGRSGNSGSETYQVVSTTGCVSAAVGGGVHPPFRRRKLTTVRM